MKTICSVGGSAVKPAICSAILVSMRLLILMMLLISGCSTVGNSALKNETQQSIANQINIGVTTKADIYSALGNPSDVSFTDGGKEILTYYYARYTPKLRSFIPYNVFSYGDDGRQKELVILLDERGVVEKFTMNESEIERRTGLLE